MGFNCSLYFELNFVQFGLQELNIKELLKFFILYLIIEPVALYSNYLLSLN